MTNPKNETCKSNPVELIVSCDFKGCKNEAVGMVKDTEETYSNKGYREFKIHYKHFYCDQHMRVLIEYCKSN